ncbi:MAG: DUF1080 domain-containing protein [Lentisphaerae bacterium]|nr:DUF1080 domain-containing protein [Lentisphaerota bacterium]
MAQALGYDDTPVLPDSEYRVHDGTRPQPRVVTPGQDGAPPSDAAVLFDGTDLSAWEACDGGAAPWKVEDGVMEVVPRSGSIRTREALGDIQLHLEWAAPSVVEKDGQGRGNSGVFLMGRYEIQVLDGYDNPTYADGITAAVYGQYPPLVNACRQPGAWQTYDLVWLGPRFDGETVTRPACVTLFHNGVLVHHHRTLIGPTAHRTIKPYSPHPETGPLQLQDHGDPVRFRNIWYRALADG